MTDIAFDENRERIKIVLPVKRNWWLFILFSACLAAWLAMLVAVIVSMIREQYGFVLTVMLLVWLVVWLWFGRVLWRRWQYHAAAREILFLTPKQLIIRRPVSLLGSTDVYDLTHVSPFYYSTKHRCPAFDYGYQHVYYGETIDPRLAEKLVEQLNDRLFPDRGDD